MILFLDIVLMNAGAVLLWWFGWPLWQDHRDRARRKRAARKRAACKPLPSEPPPLPKRTPPGIRYLDGSHENCPLSDNDEFWCDYFARRYPNLGKHVTFGKDPQ